MFDGCANGQKLKCLTVVDEFSKESLCIDAAGSIRSQHLINVSGRLIDERGCPLVVRSDSGPDCKSLLTKILGYLILLFKMYLYDGYTSKPRLGVGYYSLL